MKITFLGTGTSQGVPIIACKCDICKSKDPRDKRLRSSILIEHENANFVIDTGPDFRQQMLRENVQKLDFILITHEHKDHVAGLDDIRAFNYIQKKHMDIYAELRVQEALKREFTYVFAEKPYPGVPKMNLHLIENKVFEAFGIEITPIRVVHYELPIFGFRIHNFAYITDANYVSPEEIAKLKGVKVLVINALHRESHVSHFNLEQALEFVEQVQPQKAYLTHISHRMGKYKDIESEIPENVFFAYDQLQINY